IQAFESSGVRAGPSYANSNAAIEGEIAALSEGLIETVYSSHSPDAGNDDSIFGGSIQLFRTITGDNDANVILSVGDDLVERLEGKGGNDILESKGGHHFLDGGSGFDLVSYASAAAGVTVDLASPGANKGAAAHDFYAGVEGVVGSAHDDKIAGDK